MSETEWHNIKASTAEWQEVKTHFDMIVGATWWECLLAAIFPGRRRHPWRFVVSMRAPPESFAILDAHRVEWDGERYEDWVCPECHWPNVDAICSNCGEPK